MSEIRKAGEGCFVVHLTNVEEILGPRVESCNDAELPDTGARHKPQRRHEIFADLLPVQAHIPQIVRVANAKTEGAIILLHALLGRLENKSVNAEVLIPAQKL